MSKSVIKYFGEVDLSKVSEYITADVELNGKSVDIFLDFNPIGEISVEKLHLVF